jgi:dipeptidyl aminopeptidase/acylaminoacyl peptidase
MTIAGQRVLTAADYERAEKMLGFNTTTFVDRAGVKPTYLPDGRFWYRVPTPTASEYVLIDPLKGSRTAGESLAKLGVTPAATAAAAAKPNEIKSPDGKRAVYIKDFNLWVRDLASGKETQLTTDGVKDYGYATDNSGWRKSDLPVVLWSPDSKKIATFQQDQRHVSEMYLVSTNVGQPKLEAWKYPLPQDKEIIQIHRVIIDADTGKMVRFKIGPDARRGTLCDEISCDGDGTFGDNEWSADGSKLAFVSTARDHKWAKFRIADTATGDVREVFQETSPTQYESGQGMINWRYLPATNEAIWYSERDGWGHLYLYDLATGEPKQQITKGEFVVTRLVKMDEKTRTLYFEANGREAGRDPYFSHLYRVGMDGKNLTLLTPEDGNHSITFSPDGRFFVDVYSKPDVPPVAVLRDMTGKMVMTLEKADVSRLVASGWKPPMPVTVKSRDSKWDLYGLMFTPTNLDPKQKYPVVNYIYPGPQGGGVGSRSFTSARGDHQALAELGFVVVVIDGSCNPERSKAFHDACYGNMADNTLEDQISGIKQLAQKYPYIDLDRVGVWGHSGGGYATAAAMFRYPDFYKVGISESGNHDNRNYEDDWGERYIGLMTTDANGKSNYEDQANQVFAKNLKGKLLLAHGGMDDNVPPTNTYLVVDELIKANKEFDLIIIPNARHGDGAAT